MNNEKYDEIKNRIIKDNNITKNVSIAFFTGGFMGIIGELLFNLYITNFYI